MTKVAAIDSNNDWMFGKGRAQYRTRSAMVRQNVLTRIKSFTGDWFLNIEAHIDWMTIMGNRDNEKQILDEIRRVALSTLGVSIIEVLELVSVIDRSAIIRLRYTDIYDGQFDEEIAV